MRDSSKKGERSPRYPFIDLQCAVDLLSKLSGLKNGNKLNRGEVLKLLGFDSFSGQAARTFAALRAYHLIAPSPEGPRLTGIGRVLIDNSGDLESLQIAALSPGVFRRIWRRARNASEEELVELLMERGFTAEGALKAASIYRKNAVLAQLDPLEVEPNLPEPAKKKRPGRKVEEKLRRKLAEASRAGSDPLRLPLSSGNAVVPKGITEEEFELLIKTLHIWKDQLVRRSTSA